MSARQALDVSQSDHARKPDNVSVIVASFAFRPTADPAARLVTLGEWSLLPCGLHRGERMLSLALGRCWQSESTRPCMRKNERWVDRTEGMRTASPDEPPNGVDHDAGQEGEQDRSAEHDVGFGEGHRPSLTGSGRDRGRVHHGRFRGWWRAAQSGWRRVEARPITSEARGRDDSFPDGRCRGHPRVQHLNAHGTIMTRDQNPLPRDSTFAVVTNGGSGA